MWTSIGGSRGGVPSAHPQGSRFFRFDVQIFLNVTASEVHALPTRSTPPPPLRENSRSATDLVHLSKAGYGPAFVTRCNMASPNCHCDNFCRLSQTYFTDVAAIVIINFRDHYDWSVSDNKDYCQYEVPIIMDSNCHGHTSQNRLKVNDR